MSHFRQSCRGSGVTVEACTTTSNAATGRPIQGRPVRRLVRHRGPDHRDLLPAQLPRAPAVRAQRTVLPDRGGRATRRLPGLQTVSTRRVAEVARVECARRRRRASHAAHRRRHSGPRRGERIGSPPRVRHPAAGAAVAGRGRGRAARTGPSPTEPDGPAADRDDRPCRSVMSPSPPGSPAFANSTTPCAWYSKTPPPSCAAEQRSDPGHPRVRLGR